MVDSSPGKSLYTWMVEKDSVSGYNARKTLGDSSTITNYTKASTMFKDINTDLCSRGGGRVGIRNGTYVIDDTDIVSGRLITWGDTAIPQTNIIIEGETRDGVKIVNTRVPVVLNEDLFAVMGSVEIKNITLDGGALGVKGVNEMNMFRGQMGTDGKRIMQAYNCAFLQHTGSGFRCGSAENFLGCLSQNNFFSRLTCAGDDQCSNHAMGWGKSIGNYLTNINAGATAGFDGSALTGGTSKNMIVSNNTVERMDDPEQGISLEPFGGNESYSMISHNIVKGANVKIGMDTWAGTARYLEISDNIVQGGELRLKGPTDGTGHSTQMKYGVIKGNVVIDPPTWGIYVNNTAGFCEVRDNVVINSNTELAASISNACIRLSDCSEVVVENNTVYMGVTSPENANFSAAGIRYFNIANSKIQNNRIINNTLAPNPAYSGGGTNTGSIISRNT